MNPTDLPEDGQPPSRRIPLSAPPPAGAEPEHDEPVDFPLDALPERLRAMTEHAARCAPAPAALCAANGLAVVAACLGSGLCVQSGNSRLTFGNLYILAFAQSGTGKGRAFSFMCAPWLSENQHRLELWKSETLPRLKAEAEIARADLEKAKKQRKSAATSADEADAATLMEKAVMALEAAEDALRAEPCLNIGDATSEAIGIALAHSPGEASAIFSAEARDITANLLGRYSKDGKGSDEAIYLQAYSGDPNATTRASRQSVCLSHPRLTVCLSIQPDIWQRLAGDDRMMESGFLARCLAFDTKARPARPSDHSMPPEVEGAWGDLVSELLRTFHDEPTPPRIIAPTPEARRLLDALETESADAREAGGRWVDVAPFAARLAENAWRIAVVCHAVTHGAEAGSQPLSAGTAEDAIRLARWFFEQTLALLGPVRHSKAQARLKRLLGLFDQPGAAPEEITLRELTKSHGFTIEEIRQFAAAHPCRLRIEVKQPGPKGGRPSEVLQKGDFTTPAAVGPALARIVEERHGPAPEKTPVS